MRHHFKDLILVLALIKIAISGGIYRIAQS